jgi:hypothetical protein
MKINRRIFLRHAITACMSAWMFGMGLSHAAESLATSAVEASTSEQAYYSKERDSIRLGNRFLELRFSSQNGELQALIHKKSGVDLKKEKVNCYHTLWGMGIYTKEGKRSWTDNAKSAEFFRPKLIRVERVGRELTLNLLWEGICLDNDQSYPATVSAAISVYDGSPFSTWRIAVQNRGQHAIEKIAYPLIAGVQELGLDGSDDCLVVPTLEGRLYHDPTRNLEWAGNAYPSCFLSMQFAAYYDNNSGFYSACYDNQGYVKRFSYGKPDKRWATMFWEHYGEGIRYGADFAVPYPVTVGVFQGDWYTAADIYKQWAANQSWAKQSLQEKNIPPWLTDIGAGSCFLAVANAKLKPWNTSLAEISALSKNHHDYANCPYLINLCGWENKGAFSWGDYFPPFEGWSNYDAMVTSLHANGSRLTTLVGTSFINRETDFWKSRKAVSYAARDERGQLVVNTSDPLFSLYTMCAATPFWGQYLAGITSELTRHGSDLIQFDDFPMPPPETVCYAENHGHPLGLGKWQTDAALKNLQTIETACRAINREVCFTSEGIAEIYIPYMDAAYFWGDVYSEVGLKEQGLWNGTSEIIPLFHYIYHDRFVGQENYNLGLLIPGQSEYNLLCLSRMLVWGEIPLQDTWIKVDSDRYDKNALDLFKRIGQARTSYAKDFLVFGKMLRPLQFSCPLTTVPLGKALGSTNSAPDMQVPGIMHSAWRALDGDSGFVFVNISKTPVPLKLSLDFRKLGLRPGANPFLYYVRDGKYSVFKANSNNASSIDVIIQPLEIILIGLCEADGPRAQQVLRQINARANASEQLKQPLLRGLEKN